MATKHVYFFGGGEAEGKGLGKDVLGGKGHGLVEMTALGIPVPPGFTITTEVCTAYFRNGNRFPDGLRDDVKAALERVGRMVGTGFGDAANPLLVSVRSGARASMPGMMDTILNLGLTERTVEGLVARTNDARFAFDAYRRFVTMYANVVLGMEREPFEHALSAAKDKAGVRDDSALPAEALRALVATYKKLVREHTGADFPDDPYEQLWGAIGAVFSSWNNDRAKVYRKMHQIPDEWGTACSVQAMVFGNMGDDCATGVCFTRDPGTGEKRFFGEFLPNAQGEDVVAGIRTPLKITKRDAAAAGAKDSLESLLPTDYAQLFAVQQKLEAHFRDMQDIEFTIQKGKLWLLQTRTGKRTMRAAVRIAVDMVSEGVISKDEAVARIDAGRLSELYLPRLDPADAKAAEQAGKLIAQGLGASPGYAAGEIVFTADEAERLAGQGKDVILVRRETSPEDIHGMKAARGVLTATGGMTCVAGETLVLTDRGLMKAETLHEELALQHLQGGAEVPSRILSFDSRTMRPVWRTIVASGSRQADALTVAVSQTGNGEQNVLRLTADHKMYVVQNRRLVKKRLDAVLADGDFATVVGELPAFAETRTPPALAYVCGALFSDGYIKLGPTKGYVTFIQKPTEAKQEFIAAVECCFEQAFGVPFSYVRERETVATLRGREIRGQVEDRICFRREPAQRLAEIRDNLSTWVMSLDATALRHFLAGYVDGDGSYAEESSAVRLQIVVAASKRPLLEGLALACLRLGIVPQVTVNRDAHLLQITEGVEQILAFTQRVHAEVPERRAGARCLSVRALFADIVDDVNFMGRVKEAIKRNIMFGADKIERDILPLCPAPAHAELASLLASPLRSYRLKANGDAAPTTVYNFEVDATDELDKNYVVFSTGMTPVLISNSHAAVVARGMGKCCVAGASSLSVDYQTETLTATRAGADKLVLKKGEKITLDGTTGRVFVGVLPVSAAVSDPQFEEVMRWADEVRRLRVRANADTPLDARNARRFGAEGIGLCRTEHMFFETDRIAAVREMILAGDEAGRRRALEKIMPMQRDDFVGIFRELAGLPATIRLLDPPLHEFLPDNDAELRNLAGEMGVSFEVLKRRNEALHEFNPMLGHRGCRLAITYPEIYETQARAIALAAVDCRRAQIQVKPEIMIPLVGTREELRRLRELVVATVDAVFAKEGVRVEYHVGTMIELPRACLVADEIAEVADFFSFGTNDLTQTTWGLSRDDAGRFLPAYVDGKVIPADPFVALDQQGVGELMKLAVGKGRGVKAALKIGICGEHGGEPSSVEFCHRIGLDYVSCSPFRVPTARLAAAQAALAGKVQGSSST